jgi:hypothetical protein
VQRPLEFCTDPQRNPENRRPKYLECVPLRGPPTNSRPSKDPNGETVRQTVIAEVSASARHHHRQPRITSSRRTGRHRTTRFAHKADREERAAKLGIPSGAAKSPPTRRKLFQTAPLAINDQASLA